MRQENTTGPVFICGPSRSGTTLMTWVFQNQLDIAAVGESHYFSHLRTAYAQRLDRPLEPAELDEFETYFFKTRWDAYLAGQVGKNTEYSSIDRAVVRQRCQELGGRADDYFQAYCEGYLQVVGGNSWGEKTPRHVFRIDDILAAFPDATIVCMIRDPRSVVASFKDWGKDTSEDSAGGKKGSASAGPKSDRRKRVQQVFHPITISTLCQGAFRAAQEAAQRHGSDRVRIIKFEDLILAPREVLEQLADWLGISADIDPDNMPVSNSSYHETGGKKPTGMNPQAVDRWRKTLTPAEIRVVERTASGMLRDGGYEPSGVRANPLAMLGCYLSFAPSAMRAIVASRHRTGNLPAFVFRRFRMLLKG